MTENNILQLNRKKMCEQKEEVHSEVVLLNVAIY